MNVKRYLLAGGAVFILFQITGYVIHNLILMKTYEGLSAVWRPDMMSLMWAMYLSSAAFSLLLVYMYTKWRRNGGVIEGLHYGVAAALFMNIPGAVNQYIIYPIPFTLALQWFIFGTIEMTIAGILAALIYRPKAS